MPSLPGKEPTGPFPSQRYFVLSSVLNPTKLQAKEKETVECDSVKEFEVCFHWEL